MLKRKMADLGLGLYAAHSLISGAAEDENSGGTNWPEVVKRYEASRDGKGQVKAPTYDREERRRIERTIELINAKGRSAANDGLCRCHAELHQPALGRPQAGLRRT